MDWQVIVLILFALATCLNGKKRDENADSCNPFIISRLKSDFAFFSMALVVVLILG